MSAPFPRALPSSGRLADDRAHFDTVFRLHHDEVFAALCRVTTSDTEAEDLVQETFVALAEHRFDPGREHNLRGWLLRTAVNRAHNARRGDARRRAREASAGLRLVATKTPDTDHLEHRRRLCRALTALPPRTCQLLVLRAVGLDYAELADLIGVAKGSIGNLLVRAQRALMTQHETTSEAHP